MTDDDVTSERMAIMQEVQNMREAAYREGFDDGAKEAYANGRKDEREECMGAMDEHGKYWVENRGRIIDAVTTAGFRIMSNTDRCWLQPLPKE